MLSDELAMASGNAIDVAGNQEDRKARWQNCTQNSINK